MLGSLLVGLGAMAVLFIAAPLAARRFERRQQQRGRWDEFGPLEETAGPDRDRMSWRLEVVGLWKRRVIRRRRPHERP